MRIINWELVKQPVNWLIVIFAVMLAGVIVTFATSDKSGE